MLVVVVMSHPSFLPADDQMSLFVGVANNIVHGKVDVCGHRCALLLWEFTSLNPPSIHISSLPPRIPVFFPLDRKSVV